jgi:hypothetical protein
MAGHACRPRSLPRLDKLRRIQLTATKGLIFGTFG